MTPQQIAHQLKQELALNERLSKLLREHAKNYSDSIFRKTSSVTDHAGLLRLTGVAAGVEDFVSSILEPVRSSDRTDKGNSQ